MHMIILKMMHVNAYDGHILDFSQCCREAKPDPPAHPVTSNQEPVTNTLPPTLT